MAPFSMKNLVCVVATLSMAHSHVQLVEGKKVSNTMNTHVYYYYKRYCVCEPPRNCARELARRPDMWIDYDVCLETAAD